MTIDRRFVLQTLTGAAASVVAAPLFAQAPLPMTSAQFATLTAALTGYPAPDDATSAKMLRAFATPARRVGLTVLAKVVADTPPAALDGALRAQRLDTLANELVAAWYSGIVNNGRAGQQLVLYADAYVWTAMTFSKPMGQCGGVTGYWANPPA